MNRKELIKQYKETPQRMGVFQVKNLTNGKMYIEGSPNLDKIWNRHRTQLVFGNHLNKELQQDWNTFGEEQFQFSILDEIKQDGPPGTDYRKQLKMLETMYLEELQPYGERGYNWQPRK